METRSYWRNYRCCEKLYGFVVSPRIRVEVPREAGLSSNCSLRYCLAHSYPAKSADRALLF